MGGHVWQFTFLKKFQQEPRFRELYKKIGHPLYVD